MALTLGDNFDNYLVGYSYIENTIYAYGGDDIVVGGNYNDILVGSWGDDDMYGLWGNDYLGGGEGVDYLYGGEGHDYMDGGSETDIMLGEGGYDTLFGGAGHDYIEGGDGNDTLYGGTGYDAFGFFDFTGMDVVQDFTLGVDRIYVDHWAVWDEYDALDSLYQWGNDAILYLGSDALVLRNVNAYYLEAQDFIIA